MGRGVSFAQDQVRGSQETGDPTQPALMSIKRASRYVQCVNVKHFIGIGTPI